MNGAGPDPKLDYYAVLGIDRDADADDVRKAYRREALKYHPDKHQGDSRVRAEIRFKQLAEAYEVLKDDRLRAAYDRGGHAASAAAARGQEPPPQQSRSRSMGGDAFQGASPSPGFTWSAFSTAGAFDPSTGRFRPSGATTRAGPGAAGFRTPDEIFREAFGTDFPSFPPMFGGMPSMFGHPHPAMRPPHFTPFGSPFPTPPMFAPIPPLPPLGTTGASFTQSFGSSSMATRKSVSTSVVNGVRTTRTVETDASGTTTEETVVEYPDGTKKVEKKVNGVAQAVEAAGPRPPIAASSANANGPVPVYVNGQQVPMQGQGQQQQGGYQPVGYQPQQQQQQAQQQQQQQYEPYPYAQYPPPQYASPQQQPQCGPQYPHYQAPSKSRPNRY
ncbi:hypothetical protein GGF32_004925 [Allomyces javanicus]|nr:hypothetical protein GGF32_004925 [Allomyces javanicus]